MRFLWVDFVFHIGLSDFNLSVELISAKFKNLDISFLIIITAD